MENLYAYTIDGDRIRELIKSSDQYLQNYIRALRDVSAAWERLTNVGLKRIKDLSEENKKLKSIINLTKGEKMNAKLMGYLGDSVYGDYSTGELRLYTDNGLGAKNEIVIDGNTLTNLFKFVERYLDVKITVKPLEQSSTDAMEHAERLQFGRQL